LTYNKNAKRAPIQKLTERLCGIFRGVVSLKFETWTSQRVFWFNHAMPCSQMPYPAWINLDFLVGNVARRTGIWETPYIFRMNLKSRRETSSVFSAHARFLAKA
jgi:hypothetical protein